MPPLAAMGATAISAATAAASTITLAGLATGAAVISAGTGILAQVTGSKTLGKISMGFGIASGVGFVGDGMMSASKAMNPSTSVGSKGLLETDNIDDILKSPTKGTKAAQAQGLKTFDDTPTGQIGSMNGFRKGSNRVGLDSGRGAYGANGVDAMGNPNPDFDPELEKSFFQRANDTLTKYNPLINIAAGVGQGYMQGQQMEQQERLFDKRLAQDQQLIDRTLRNNSNPIGVGNASNSLNLSRTANPLPLLQR